MGILPMRARAHARTHNNCAENPVRLTDASRDSPEDHEQTPRHRATEGPSLRLRLKIPVTHMKKTNFFLTVAMLLAGLCAASAHIGYTNRDFGTLIIDNSTVVRGNQTISSSFGWADAADSDYGDSHRGRFYRFTLTSTASVVISVQRDNAGTSANGTESNFLPGISLFQGLGHLSPDQESHDSAALSVSSRDVGTEGSLRTLTNWSIGNDPTYNPPNPETPLDPYSGGILYPASLRSFTYVGHIADGTSANFGSAAGIVGDGVADGFVTATFADLGAGDYSIFVGGASYGRQTDEPGPTYPTYGVDVSVRAIPEPGTIGLIVLGLGTFAFIRSRRRTK